MQEPRHGAGTAAELEPDKDRFGGGVPPPPPARPALQAMRLMPDGAGAVYSAAPTGLKALPFQ